MTTPHLLPFAVETACRMPTTVLTGQVYHNLSVGCQISTLLMVDLGCDTNPLVGDLSMGTKPKKPSPLLLSSALPPVPSKSLEKIQNGTYLDFKELLPDNISLLQNAQDLGGSSAASMANSKLREVPDSLSWVACFLTFMGSWCPTC